MSGGRVDTQQTSRSHLWIRSCRALHKTRGYANRRQSLPPRPWSPRRSLHAAFTFRLYSRAYTGGHSSRYHSLPLALTYIHTQKFISSNRICCHYCSQSLSELCLATSHCHSRVAGLTSRPTAPCAPVSNHCSSGVLAPYLQYSLSRPQYTLMP